MTVCPRFTSLTGVYVCTLDLSACVVYLDQFPSDTEAIALLDLVGTRLGDRLSCWAGMGR